MPTKPEQQTLSPSRISATASSAVTILSFIAELEEEMNVQSLPPSLSKRGTTSSLLQPTSLRHCRNIHTAAGSGWLTANLDAVSDS
jgi:hypothetical protein